MVQFDSATLRGRFRRRVPLSQESQYDPDGGRAEVPQVRLPRGLRGVQVGPLPRRAPSDSAARLEVGVGWNSSGRGSHWQHFAKTLPKSSRIEAIAHSF